MNIDAKSPGQSITARAAALCDAQGKRLTHNRRLVLEVMSAHQGAMSAYEIVDALHASLPGVKPPTVYRVLEFLIDLGIVHQVESRNRFLLCSHPQHQHQAQILVCDCCNCIEELVMSDEVLEALRVSASQHGFKLTRHTFELHGVCARCQQSCG